MLLTEKMEGSSYSMTSDSSIDASGSVMPDQVSGETTTRARGRVSCSASAREKPPPSTKKAAVHLTETTTEGFSSSVDDSDAGSSGLSCSPGGFLQSLPAESRLELLSVSEVEVIQITSVWLDRFAGVREEIMNIVEEGENLTVFLDTEFCRRGRSFRRGEPPSPEEYYIQTRETVDGGDLIQVGLLIVETSSYQVLGHGAYEFKIRFDAGTRPSDEVAWHRKHLVQLEQHASQGIPVQDFATFLKSTGLTNNKNITWITFQAYLDYGYLMRALQEVEALPEEREEFLNWVAEHFPTSYDLKVLHRLGISCKKAVPGSDGLKDLGAGLAVERKEGEAAHNAASDAIFTMRCFIKMLHREPPPFQPIRRFRGILHGLMDAVDVSSYVRDTVVPIRTVHVWASNLSDESKVICSLFTLLGTVAVEIQQQQQPSSRAGDGEDAEDAVKIIEIAIADGRGHLALDKLWIFHVRSGGKSDSHKELSAADFAGLLTRSRAIMSSASHWVSSSSGTFRYLLDILITAPVPPESDIMFYKLREAFFPKCTIDNVNDGEGASSCPRALVTLRRSLERGRKGSS